MATISRSVNSTTNKIELIGFVLAILFCILRLGGDPLLQKMPQWISFAFEAIFLGISAFLLKPSLDRMLPLREKKLLRAFAPLALFGLSFGILVVLVAGVLSLTIPWDFKTSLTTMNFSLLFHFLLLGPLVEELLFRWALWDLLGIKIKSSTILIGVTSVLFSVNHLTSSLGVDLEIKQFIYFQTFYTLLLGITCGIAQVRTRTWIFSFALHVFFNLGFILGCLIL